MTLFVKTASAMQIWITRIVEVSGYVGESVGSEKKPFETFGSHEGRNAGAKIDLFSSKLRSR